MNNINHKNTTLVALGVQGEEVVCNLCDLFGMCRTVGLNDDEVRLNRFVKRRVQVIPNEQLALEGEKFRYVYAVKSGALKSYILTRDGKEQIVDFHLPGELIGLDGMATGRYQFSVNAIIMSSVCRMRIADVTLSDEEMLRFQRRHIEAMSRKVLYCQQALVLIGSRSVERSVAIFILNLSDRFMERGMSCLDIRLPMGREDIANYLGVANETVSRALSRMHEQGVIYVRGRNLSIRNVGLLRKAAGMDC